MTAVHGALRLAGVRAVVTGASRGLGRVVAEEYVRQGASVVATAQEPAHLDALVRACAAAPGTLVRTVGADLGTPDGVAAVAAAARAGLGRVDVLVNNAGLLGTRTWLIATPAEELTRLFAVNVAGPIGLVAALADAFADGGVIINVTSGAAGRSSWGAYALTKAALDTASAMLAEELAARGVRCVALNPGAVRTDMRHAAVPEEDPATVPHPRTVLEPFVAIAAGAPAAGIVEARRWPS